MPNAPHYLLDTNILVAYVRAGALGEHIEKTYGLLASAFKPLICVVSVGEMLSLAAMLRWSKKKTASLEGLLSELVLIDINNSEILAAYAELDVASQRHTDGARNMGKNDLWIASAAKVTGATLLTTDRDFDHLHPTKLTRIWVDPKSGKPA